jgi:murein DD-endopeptidase MepM/ murein hydrolase activator NlpD
LISNIPAVMGRLRHFWIEGAAGVALTLAVASAASASLPPANMPMTRPAPAPTPVVATPAPAPPPVFACSDPVPGHEVDSPYGLRRLPWERQGRLHEGVDIAAPKGAPVLAVAGGVVIRTGDSPTYGRFVEIRHGEAGLTSFYAHLGKIERTAQAGAYLGQGTVLGRIGLSGTSTGPHLHFEIRQDGKALNPAAFLDRKFETQDDLPIKAASYISPHVRVAEVSFIPEAKRALMAEAPTGRGRHGRRVRQTLQLAQADTAV